MIDRTRLAVVFAEHRLGGSGLIAPDEAKQLGQLVGADVLVSATMTPFGDEVRLSVKALDTETATLRASARGKVGRSGTIDELLGRGMEDGSGGGGGGGGGAGGAKGKPRVDPVTARGFVFELQGCRLSGTTAECLVVVENQAGDRSLWLWDHSRLFDDLGNEYPPSSLSVANETKVMQWHASEHLDKLVLERVPTPPSSSPSRASRTRPAASPSSR